MRAPLSLTTAAAVSSQLVSMPSTSMRARLAAVRCHVDVDAGLARETVDADDNEIVFDGVDAGVAEVVDEIAPGIVEAADAGDVGDNTADLELALQHVPAAQQQSHDDLQMTAEIHEEVHAELQAIDADIDGEDVVDARCVAPAPRSLAVARDQAGAEPAQHPDARGAAPVDGALHQRHEEQLRQEEREARRGEPGLVVEEIGDHREHDPALEQWLGDAGADEAAD